MQQIDMKYSVMLGSQYGTKDMGFVRINNKPFVATKSTNKKQTNFKRTNQTHNKNLATNVGKEQTYTPIMVCSVQITITPLIQQHPVSQHVREQHNKKRSIEIQKRRALKQMLQIGAPQQLVLSAFNFREI